MMISIQRKKNRIEELNLILNNKELKHSHDDIRLTIGVLSFEIKEDKKMLPKERNELKKSYEEGFNNGEGHVKLIKKSNEWYNQKYTNHGK